jgi:oligo-1,6-glucosidase/alpha-glucosidase
MLSLYRKLLALRRAEPALALGSIERVEASEHVLAYRRSHGRSRLQIILNLTGTERQMPDGAGTGECLLSTLGSTPPEGWLRPDEGVVFRLPDA